MYENRKRSVLMVEWSKDRRIGEWDDENKREHHEVWNELWVGVMMK